MAKKNQNIVLLSINEFFASLSCPQEAASLRGEVAALSRQLHDGKKKFLAVAKRKQAEYAAALAAVKQQLAQVRVGAGGPV